MRETKIATLPEELRPEGRNRLVRLGSRYDGGYVVAAALLDRVEQLLSFGLGLNWDFERDIARLTPVTRIECYDHTVDRRYFARKLAKAYFSFITNPVRYRKRIADCRNYPVFFDGRKAVHHQMKVGAEDGPGQSSMNAALDRLEGAGDNIFLKCDIEGAEYEIGDAIVSAATRFCGMAFEFHGLGRRADEMLEMIRALKKTHCLDHVHVNNTGLFSGGDWPPVLEISLSRRDISDGTDPERLDSLGVRHSRSGEALDAANKPSIQGVTIQYS